MALEVSVSPANIESELSRIWEALETKNKMRASLFNLIIYTKHNHREEYLRSVAQRLIDKFPSRIIFITMDPSAKNPFLNTSVSILWAGGKETSEIACDLIQFNGSICQEEKIPFLILPHILPDLPVYLVWADDIVKDNPLSEHLERFATRLIFDSESTGDLNAFVKAVINHKTRSNCAIADLNWARLESWRHLLSSTFKEQGRLLDLADTRSIDIQYNAQETPFFCHTKIQAIYLQCWLASRLGWKFQKATSKDSTLILEYTSSDKPITVTLIPLSDPNMAPGTIASFDLKTHHDKHFFLARKKEIPNHVRVQVSTKDICEVPTLYIFTKSEAGQSMIKEITKRGTSDHYETLLEYINRNNINYPC